MEYEQLGCLKLTGLSDVKNNLKWSCDDKIAVVTRKGVHVVGLSGDCTSSRELKLLSSVIEVKNEFPTHQHGLDADKLFLNTRDKFVIYEMMLDPLIYKGLRQTENQPPVPLQAEWSQKRIPGLDGCALAVRSSSGGVYIYFSKMRDWLELCDVSQMRRAIVSQQWVSSNDSLQLLKSRIDQIYATALCWAEEQNCEEPLLWVAYADGSVAAWKIDSVGAELRHCIELKNTSRICHISCCNESLIVGNDKGKVYLLCPSSGNLSELWPHEDNIAVESSLAIHVEPEGCIVVAVKGSCLVAAAVNNNSDSKLIGAKNFGTIGISGLIHLKDSKFLISHVCGSIEMVSLKLSSMSIVFSSQQLKHKLNSTIGNTHGIAVSRNRLIYAASQCIFAPHDHLMLREPSSLTFFTYSSVERVWPLLSNLEAAEQLQFSRILDIFEIIRLTGGMTFWQNQEGCAQQVEKIPVLHRKLLIWSIECAKQLELDDEVIRLKRILVRLDKGILARSFLKRVARVPQEPTFDELVSLQLMTNFLKNLLTEDPWILTRQEMELVNSLPKINAIEKCAICAEDVEIVEGLEMRCVRGHTLPRCCLSLMQCCETPYRVCRSCQLCCLLSPYFNAEPHCVFCNEPMVEEVF